MREPERKSEAVVGEADRIAALLTPQERRYLRGLVRNAEKAPVRVQFVEVNVDVLRKLEAALASSSLPTEIPDERSR